jgi:DNA modification methylase
MTTAPYWHDATSALYVGDARDVLADTPDGSADCIVTSLPYRGKRDDGVAGQYGREPDPAGYVATLTPLFAEARRVLADDGTCWLNLGDCYSAGWGAATGMHAYLGPHLTAHKAPGMPAKNLLGTPWRVAFALEDDGWILRNAIVWHKPNAMPESVKDRLNCRHELIFLLVKQPAYWCDLDPIRVPRRAAAPTQPPARPRDAYRGPARPPNYGPRAREVTARRRYGGLRGSGSHRRGHTLGRNPGDVWAIPTCPYNGPRFAAYPIDPPLRCIAAGCKPGGTVLDPFTGTGTGTTGLAARQLGRFTGIELNPAFAVLAAERLRHAAIGQPGGSDGGRP